jgi:hypothetical protein
MFSSAQAHSFEQGFPIRYLTTMDRDSRPFSLSHESSARGLASNRELHFIHECAAWKAQIA